MLELGAYNQELGPKKLPPPHTMTECWLLQLSQEIMPSAVTKNCPLKFQTLAVLTGLRSPTRLCCSIFEKASSAASLVSRTPAFLKKRQVPLCLFQGPRHLGKSVECRFTCIKDTGIIKKMSSATSIVSRTLSTSNKPRVLHFEMQKL